MLDKSFIVAYIMMCNFDVYFCEHLFRISQIISGTKSRSEMHEAALESTRLGAPEALLKLGNVGHLTGQGQVKGQNRTCSHLGLWGPHCR